MARGAPKLPDLTDKEIESIGVMSGMGLNMSQIAAILGFSKDTLERKRNDDVRISAAIEKGRGNNNLAVAESLFHQATQKKNVLAQMFWLKTRARWCEAQFDENEDETKDNSFKLAYKK